MKLREFERAAFDEFGAVASVYLRDTVLLELSNRTANEALDSGVPPREVWLALCRAHDVPKERWFGVGLAPGRS